jgi:hypothetical protein
LSGFGNAGADTVLARWQAKAVRWVWLPSRTWAQIRLPSAMGLVNAGVLPDELVALAMRFATGTIELDTLSPDDLRGYERLRAVMLLRSVVAIDPDARPDPDNPGQPLDPHPQPFTFDSEDDLYILPAEDQAALQSLVDRRRTIEQVTAAVMALDELASTRMMAASAEAQDRMEAAEAEPTTASVAGFRAEPGGADPGPDGREVRPTP